MRRDTSPYDTIFRVKRGDPLYQAKLQRSICSIKMGIFCSAAASQDIVWKTFNTSPQD